MSASWRPFASNFVSHAFDNFIKKYERAETAPVVKVKRARGKIDISQLFPFKHSKDEVQERMERFKNLQKRVTRQRLLIKQKDKIIERNSELRLELERKRRFESRTQKNGIQVRFRNLYTQKPSTVPARVNYRSSSTHSKYEKTRNESPTQPGGIFSLTSANENSRLNQSTITVKNQNISNGSSLAKKAHNTTLPTIPSRYEARSQSVKNHQFQIHKKFTNIPTSNLDKSNSKVSATYQAKERIAIRKSTKSPAGRSL